MSASSIILQPGLRVFSPAALVPLLSAFMFALYGLLTRYVSRGDTASVSFFWTGAVGALAMTPVGLWHWEPMTPGRLGLDGPALLHRRLRPLAADPRL